MLKAQLEACFGTLSAVVESFLSVGAPTFVALVALKQLESYIGFAPAFFASDMGELAEKASKEKFSGLDPMLSSKDMPRD